MRASLVRLTAEAREMLSTSEFIQQCREMERAIGGKVSWPSTIGIGGILAGALAYINDSRLTSAKEVIQKDIEVVQKDIGRKHLELKQNLERLTEQVARLNSQGSQGRSGIASPHEAC